MNKKSMILVGAAFAVIIIALIIYLILTLTTDLFKPTSEVYQRYLKECVESISNNSDFSKEQAYINILTHDNYKDDTKIEFRYKNSQEIVEKFNISSEGTTNNSEKNSYRKMNIKYGEDYNVMDIEYLQESQKYGILFSNVVKQFISADIESLEKLKSLIGIDIKELGKTDTIELLSQINKEKDTLKEVFLKYISKVGENRYSKQKETTVILNNGETKNVKEFKLNLTEEETKELFIEFLNTLKKESEINTINSSKTLFPKTTIILYVLDNKTIRTAIDIDNKQFRIDLYENQLNIKYNEISGEEIKTLNIDAKKEGQSTIVEYSDSYNNKINAKYDINEENNIKNLKLIITLQNDYIKGIAFELDQNLETMNGVIDGIDKKLSEQKVVDITELSDSNRNSAINGLLKRIDSVLFNENNQINSEFLNIVIQFNKKIETEYQGMKDKLKNEFNNRFLAYKGQNVEKEIIYNLLDLSGLNMKKYEEIGEDSYRIHLSQGTSNMSLVQEIKNKIEKSRKIFDVNFGFDSEGKVNSIEITGHDQ